MILYINTIKNHFIEISLRKEGAVVVEKKIDAKYSQAERLLPEIENLLLDDGYGLNDISKIEVENRGDNESSSFTSLRVGVIVANALGFALRVKVVGLGKTENKTLSAHNIVEPVYDKKPNISIGN